jgi:hypothetical protein
LVGDTQCDLRQHHAERMSAAASLPASALPLPLC